MVSRDDGRAGADRGNVYLTGYRTTSDTARTHETHRVFCRIAGLVIRRAQPCRSRLGTSFPVSEQTERNCHFVSEENMIGSTVARLFLGHRLKSMRERRGIHTEDAAAEAGVARATLWRMEKGDTRCRYKPGDVEVLARLYGADQETIDKLVYLAKATRAPSWLANYRDVLADIQETYIDLEGYALRVRCYANAVIPDLLQIVEYASAQLLASRTLADVQARKIAQLRVRRQHILTRDGQDTKFEFILDEAALRREVGKPAVMAAQLARVMHVARLVDVSVRVVPHRVGMYPGLESGPFTILIFPEDEQFGQLPTNVYLHRLGEHQLLDKPLEVDRYEEQWDDARAFTLDQGGSLRQIAEIAEGLTVH